MAIELTANDVVSTETAETPWGAVTCLSLLTFLLVGLEFLPVSLLTPIARDLSVSEGQAGLAITVSGVFAVLTSLFGNGFLAKWDRKAVVLIYTGVLALSSLAVALAPNFAVFLAGRALVGVAIGGFWSLSTAILARLASKSDLPKAIALLQGGTAFAVVVAAPLGSFLGGLIGWRGTFLITVPIGLAALVWQFAVLPKMPATETVSVGRMFRLLRNRAFLIGGDGSGLHGNERAFDLSASVSRRCHRGRHQHALADASGCRTRRLGRDLPDRLRSAPTPDRRADRLARHGRADRSPAYRLRVFTIGHRGPSRALGILLDPDPGGLEHLDGEAGPR
jgi:hypothetical protein